MAREKVYMSHEESAKRSAESRHAIMEHIKKAGVTTTNELVPIVNMTKAQVRVQLRWLTEQGYIVSRSENGNYKKTQYFISDKNFDEPAPPKPVVNPYARVVNLLDRKPVPLTDAERKARRREASVTRGSSMSMFDSF